MQRHPPRWLALTLAWCCSASCLPASRCGAYSPSPTSSRCRRHCARCSPASSGLAGIADPGRPVPAALALACGRAAFLGLFVVLVACWFQIAPTNEGQWRPEVAVLPYATVDGNLVTVHNIRNFDYRTETDFTPAYYDATFDASKLDSVDLFAVYWMGPAIAHGIISFGFADGQHLAVSIEARSPHGAGYSTISGFFRQYEVHYVVADERDVIRLRTNYRKTRWRTPTCSTWWVSPRTCAALFMNYIDKINSLKEHPEFYNSLTDNCITGIWQNARGNAHALLLLEAAGERLRARVPVREGQARHARPVRGVAAARPHQRARPCGRQGRRTSRAGSAQPAHPGGGQPP